MPDKINKKIKAAAKASVLGASNKPTDPPKTGWFKSKLKKGWVDAPNEKHLRIDTSGYSRGNRIGYPYEFIKRKGLEPRKGTLDRREVDEILKLPKQKATKMFENNEWISKEELEKRKKENSSKPNTISPRKRVIKKK